MCLSKALKTPVLTEEGMEALSQEFRQTPIRLNSCIARLQALLDRVPLEHQADTYIEFDAGVWHEEPTLDVSIWYVAPETADEVKARWAAETRKKFSAAGD